MNIEFNINDFMWQKDTKCFVAEISELVDKYPDLKFSTPSTISITNPKTKKTEPFDFYKVDKTDGGDDIAGWRFKGRHIKLNALIIND